MYPFAYHRPTSLNEAEALLGGEEDSVAVAGGMSLVPVMKHRLAAPSDLVDLSAIDGLRGISVTDSRVEIGAMTPHAIVAADAAVARAIPALTKLAGGIGDPLVRNRGTIGGSLANNDPAACYPSAVLGLGATIITARREIAGDDYFIGLFETALAPDEIITAVRFPIPDAACYVKFPNPASRFSIVGVFVSRTGDGVRVAVTGAGAGVFRVASFEDALSAEFSPDAINDILVPAGGLTSDMHGSAEFRAHLIRELTRQAVEACG